MAARVQTAGLDIDQPTIDGLDSDLATGRARLDRLDPPCWGPVDRPRSLVPPNAE